MESIIVAIITGGLALIGVIFSNAQSNRKIEQQLQTAQAVTDVKIDNLREEVKKHNDFACKIPVIEQRLTQVEEDIKDLRNV
jgi:type II secretory pathway pseudopilin PulG